MLALLRRFGLTSALCWSSLGCSSSATTTSALPHPTVIEVSPDEFAQPPSCGSEAGSLQRYLATLIDVTPSDGDAGAPVNFTLPSSALQIEAGGTIHYEPIPCLQAVNFGWVVSGHTYRAELLGFDRSDLHLLEGGLPVAIDAATRAVVQPRWRATCGTTTPVRAEAELTRTVHDCDAWVASD
ncbi:MAG: hypothetical protein QM756_13300 [Polyangiaceae bacterium]